MNKLTTNYVSEDNPLVIPVGDLLKINQKRVRFTAKEAWYGNMEFCRFRDRLMFIALNRGVVWNNHATQEYRTNSKNEVVIPFSDLIKTPWAGGYSTESMKENIDHRSPQYSQKVNDQIYKEGCAIAEQKEKAVWSEKYKYFMAQTGFTGNKFYYTKVKFSDFVLIWPEHYFDNKNWNKISKQIDQMWGFSV